MTRSIAHRMATGLAWLALAALAGCGEDQEAPAAPEPAEPTTAEPAEPEVPSEPAEPEPTPEETPADPAAEAPALRPLAEAGAHARAAAEALRIARSAFDRGDADTYAESYAEALPCFFGRPSTRAAVLRARRERLEANRAAHEAERRWDVHRIRNLETWVERESADEVVLHDWGWTGPGGGSEGTVFHAKRITLARDGARWRITHEAPIGHACDEGPERPTPPAIWTALESGYRRLVESCTGGTLEDGYPGIGGSNGCMCETNLPDADAYCLQQSRCAEYDACADRIDRCIDGRDAAELNYFCFLSEEP